MFPRAATRDAARVLGLDYGAGDRIAKLIPEPIMGRSKSFDEYLAEEPDLRRVYDSEPEARQIIDTAQRPRGDRPQLVDPRGRGRDRRPAAHGHRAAADGGRPDRHPVLDEADRGDRPAEDGLPRAAEPRRDRGRARHHRGVERRAAGHDEPAARRREDLRDAPAGRLGRRVPVRVRGHARGAQEGAAGRVQRPRGAERALPPGRDALHRHLRAQQARSRTRSPTSTSACARSPSPRTA